MSRILCGECGVSVFAASTFGSSSGSSLGSIFGSTLASILGASALGEVSSCSGARRGASISDAAVTGALAAVSALVGSGFCSLTWDSPGLIDHLVTFNACQFVTGRRRCRNFRNLSGADFGRQGGDGGA